MVGFDPEPEQQACEIDENPPAPRQGPQGLACAGFGSSVAVTAVFGFVAASSDLVKSTAELLQQMYAEADEDGKLALSKAWEDGREKREGAKK